MIPTEIRKADEIRKELREKINKNARELRARKLLTQTEIIPDTKKLKVRIQYIKRINRKRDEALKIIHQLTLKIYRQINSS